MINNYIFLDIDGVLNHQSFYENTSPEERGILRERLNDEWDDPFCSISTALLNQLIIETKSKIVISSTKRLTKFISESYEANLKCLQSMWKQRGFEGEVVGFTPSMYLKINNKTWDYKESELIYLNSVPRGCEIEQYLKNKLGFSHINWSKEEQLKYMEKSGVRNYIIIDDDSDMLYTQRNHFVHVLPSPRNLEGFNEHYYRQAKEKLTKDIIQLNYD